MADADELGADRDERAVDRCDNIALERLRAAGRATVAARRVDRLDLLDAVGQVRGARRGVDDDHDVGAGRVGDQRVGGAERAAQLAGCEAGQPALLLGGRAGVLDRQRGERAAQERHRARVAELLEQDAELDDAEPLAAVLLADRDAGPAQLAQLARERVVVGARLGGLADLRHRRAVGQQVMRGALDLLLVLGQCESHLRSS